MDAPFDPLNQTFRIAGPDGVADIEISMATIEAQRQRLARICINYGCQLGLTIMSLIVVAMLLPSYKMRRALHIAQTSALVVAVIRLSLLVLYFPGPLSGYYVAWTRDASVLEPPDYYINTTANSFAVVQFALIELALILQSWAMIRTWPERWHMPVLFFSTALAIATVVVKALWVVHHTQALRGHTLPVALDQVGETAVALGAMSIFFFCGIFFAHLSRHLTTTRGALTRPDRGLTSLEILAIGNGILMLLPSLFAGLDIAAGIGDNRVLPFDAGSWVQTITVSGMPLIGLVAFYRGSNSRLPSRKVSLFAHGPFPSNNTDEATLGGGASFQIGLSTAESGAGVGHDSHGRDREFPEVGPHGEEKPTHEHRDIEAQMDDMRLAGAEHRGGSEVIP
jgi:pheromone alpha factor receptor